MPGRGVADSLTSMRTSFPPDSNTMSTSVPAKSSVASGGNRAFGMHDFHLEVEFDGNVDAAAGTCSLNKTMARWPEIVTQDVTAYPAEYDSQLRAQRAGAIHPRRQQGRHSGQARFAAASDTGPARHRCCTEGHEPPGSGTSSTRRRSGGHVVGKGQRQLANHVSVRWTARRGRELRGLPLR